MIKQLKQLSKESAIYGMGSLFNVVLGFVLIPLYTRYLSPADYGVYSLMVIISQVATTIAALGMASAMFREVIYHEADESEVISTTLNFLVLEALVFFAVLLVLAPKLAGVLLGGEEHALLLQLLFVGSLLSMTDFVVMAALRIRAKPALYSSLVVTKFVAGIIFNIFFIVVLRQGLAGLIYTRLAQGILSTIINVAILAKNWRPRINWPILRRMLDYGVPIMPVAIASIALTSSDRYFLEHFASTTEVGIYSLGYKLGMVVSMMVSAVSLAWGAQLFVIAKQPNAEQKYARILTYYLVTVGFVGLIISVLSREVLQIFTAPAYYDAYTVVPLIVISYIFYGAMYMTNIALPVQGKTRYNTVIVIGAALLNLGINSVLIPRFGMMGAAVSTVLSYLALLIVQAAVNLHFWYIPYEYGRIVRLGVAWALVYGISLLIQTPSPWLGGALKGVLILAFPVILYVLGFYSEEELKMIRRTGGKLLKRLPHRRQVADTVA